MINEVYDTGVQVIGRLLTVSATYVLTRYGEDIRNAKAFVIRNSTIQVKPKDILEVEGKVYLVRQVEQTPYDLKLILEEK